MTNLAVLKNYNLAKTLSLTSHMPMSQIQCGVSQMANNLQSLPNLFHMLFRPSLTKVNQEGLPHSNCLPGINANCQSFTNFYPPTTKKKLQCLCTAISETQICYHETPSLQQGIGKSSMLNCITSSR